MMVVVKSDTDGKLSVGAVPASQESALRGVRLEQAKDVEDALALAGEMLSGDAEARTQQMQKGFDRVHETEDKVLE